MRDHHFRLLHGTSFHLTPHSRHVSALLCWYVKSHGMCSHVLGLLCSCGLMFVYSLMFLCCTHALVVMPLNSCPHAHALVLMPSCSGPRAHALVRMPSCSCPCHHALIPDSLSVSLLVVYCNPASIVLMFHGFVYVLPVWSVIKPLFLYIVHLGPTFLFHRLTPRNINSTIMCFTKKLHCGLNCPHDVLPDGFWLPQVSFGKL